MRTDFPFSQQPMAPSGSQFENPVFISQGGFSRLKEVSRVLWRVGIQSEVVAPPEGAKLNA